jgi:hypothetical protein
MTEWQPIETAPKDGSDVLLTVVYRGTLPVTRLGAWRQFRPGQYDWLQHHTFEKFTGDVTHWMPLPVPAGAADGERMESTK